MFHINLYAVAMHDSFPNLGCVPCFLICIMEVIMFIKRSIVTVAWPLWPNCFVCSCRSMPQRAGETPHWNIYIDADWSHSLNSSQSIEWGLKTAIKRHGGQLAGRELRIVRSDHRRNSRRTTLNLDTFLADPNALLVVSGMHSPPLLANMEKINDNNILTLIPWAAAAPLTRRGPDNWFFRLSLDDRYAGEVMAEHAINERKMQNPVMLLEETGWGKSNHKAMTQKFQQLGLSKPSVLWFNWGIGDETADILLRQVVSGGHDGVILVANASEGVVFSQAMARLPQEKRVPIISHWGITGGRFHEQVDAASRREIDLTFLQTSFSFLSDKPSEFASDVWAEAIKSNQDMPREARQLKSPSGFIHAFDMGSILMAAAKQVPEAHLSPWKRAKSCAKRSITYPRG